PCGARFHVNGVFARDRCEPIANAHGILGSKRAMVVHGAGGLDEFAPSGHTHVAELKDGSVRSYDVSPTDFGLGPADPAGLMGGEPACNATIINEVLYGVAHESVRNAAVMTAAAALYIVGEAADLRTGAGRAAAALKSGAARGVLETLRRIAPRGTQA